jgi:hypothetical protein
MFGLIGGVVGGVVGEVDDMVPWRRRLTAVP